MAGVVINPNGGRPKINEAAFQAQVMRFARLTGWLVHHSRPSYNRSGRVSTAIAGDAGLPDLILAKGGRVVFLELKGDGGSIQANQRAWGGAIAGRPIERGVVVEQGPLAYLLAYPDDWAAVEGLLRR